MVIAEVRFGDLVTTGNFDTVVFGILNIGGILLFYQDIHVLVQISRETCDQIL